MSDEQTYVVIVTGWRGAGPAHRFDIATALEELRDSIAFHPSAITLKHGKCPYGGVDLLADGIAREMGWTVQEFPPEIKNGRIEGPARNRAMVASGADMVLAFPGPGSRGTWDCLHWAQRYGIPFRGYPLQLVRGAP